MLPEVGSDYYGILFRIPRANTLENTPLPRFNIARANWPLFSSLLKESLKNSSLIVNSQEFKDLDENKDFSSELLDKAAAEFTEVITKTAKLTIPSTKLGIRAKP